MPLLSALSQGMEKRFGGELSLTFAAADKIIGAIAHPYFKLWWLPEDKRDQCRQLFIGAARSHAEQQKAKDVNSSITTGQHSDPDDFYHFEETHAVDVSCNEVEKECATYIVDLDVELQMLSKYPHIRDIFILYMFHLQLRCRDCSALESHFVTV